MTDDIAADTHELDPRWLRAEEWLLRDAAVLLSGLDPSVGAGRMLRVAIDDAIRSILRTRSSDGITIRSRDVDDMVSKFGSSIRSTISLAQDIYNNATAAVRSYKLELSAVGGVVPASLLSWGKRKGYVVPAFLETVLQRAEPAADFKIPQQQVNSEAPPSARAETKQLRKLQMLVLTQALMLGWKPEEKNQKQMLTGAKAGCIRAAGTAIFQKVPTAETIRAIRHIGRAAKRAERPQDRN